MPRRIGISTARIACQASRKITVITATGEPGRVEKLSKKGLCRFYTQVLRKNVLFHIVDR
tara:strand:+ start:540 stop:719 length:180 start_codon:yes stop_codon:yes gene_type:complete